MERRRLVFFPGLPELLLGAGTVARAQAPIVIMLGGVQEGWSGGPQSA